MKKITIGFSGVIISLFIAMGGVPWVCAQEEAIDEFTLEEIRVTAEKREVNVQEVPSSVQVLVGTNLREQGKITTKQILEDVPNVTYLDGGFVNPNSNIAIRGIQRTQSSGGEDSIIPATTATYVDGVFGGIGGNYDINRVEILRGPQGTLYGRSATGGVVSFYTNDPILGEFSGSISAEYGKPVSNNMEPDPSSSFSNLEAVVNVPVSDSLALRVAGHLLDRDGYFDPDGENLKIKEGRIKAYFKPSDTLDMMLSLSAQETISNGGGYTAYLLSPTEIDYDATYSEPMEGSPNNYRQAMFNLNYNFSKSTLTYIAGYHDFDMTGLGAEVVANGHGHVEENSWPVDYKHIQEIRWASSTEDQITWLVGANYFKHKFNHTSFSLQTIFPDDPELSPEEGYGVPTWGRETAGVFENYGLFTEETFKLRDNFRITAGMRYDKTELVQDVFFYQNQNTTSMGIPMNPPDYYHGGYSALLDDTHTYDNFTYKLRFEYDMTPDNMVYLLTATGFMPGYTALVPSFVGFRILQLDQQKLTSYEAGMKNQFLDNTLRLNTALFYYDYEGYPEAVNLTWMGVGVPSYSVISVPLEVKGSEIEVDYLITMYDKISFSIAALDVRITEWPETVTWREMTGAIHVTPGRDAAVLERLPGHPQLKVNLTYDHTFMLNSGATIVPRVELNYTDGYYVTQVDGCERDSGQVPWAYQDSRIIADIGTTWTSPSGKYSMTAYLRNALDKEYKTDITPSPSGSFDAGGNPLVTVEVGEPRVFGIMFKAKF